jgi:hypothetical protein
LSEEYFFPSFSSYEISKKVEKHIDDETVSSEFNFTSFNDFEDDNDLYWRTVFNSDKLEVCKLYFVYLNSY